MHILQGALSSNAASLGLNWIYNMPYLEKLADKEAILFIPIDPSKYKRARKAYLAYPEASVGDFTLQGHILNWFYERLKEDDTFKAEDYKAMLVDHLKPGGSYIGWVESYGKKLIYNTLVEDLKLNADPLTLNDDQLVGFAPYIALKSLGKDTKRAWDYVSVLTSNEDYIGLFKFFDHLMEALNNHPLQTSIEHSIDHAPDSLREVLYNAVNTKDIKTFLKDNNLNTACSIYHGIPLVVHILYHTNGFEDAVHMNTKIGGASSDRGLMLGAVLAEAYGVPDTFIEKTNL